MPALAARLVRAPRAPGFRRVLAAQLLSWGGDVALTGRSRPLFLAGLGAFLAAHVSYVSAYRDRSSAPLLASAACRRLLLAGGGATVAMTTVAARHDRSLAAPVAAYGVTLTGMVASAAAIDADRGRGRVLTGSLLFLLSDTLIGVRKFLLADGAPAVETAVWATYSAAQWCIGDGMARR